MGSRKANSNQSDNRGSELLNATGDAVSGGAGRVTVKHHVARFPGEGVEVASTTTARFDSTRLDSGNWIKRRSWIHGESWIRGESWIEDGTVPGQDKWASHALGRRGSPVKRRSSRRRWAKRWSAKKMVDENGRQEKSANSSAAQQKKTRSRQYRAVASTTAPFDETRAEAS